MRKKQDINQFTKSQEVIEQYIRYVKRMGASPTHHRARVLIGKRNYNYNKILEIGVMIETNYSKLIICDDGSFCQNYKPEYTNEYQIFGSYSAGTLIVRSAEDNFGNPIEINISFFEK